MSPIVLEPYQRAVRIDGALTAARTPRVPNHGVRGAGSGRFYGVGGEAAPEFVRHAGCARDAGGGGGRGQFVRGGGLLVNRATCWACGVGLGFVAWARLP